MSTPAARFFGRYVLNDPEPIDSDFRAVSLAMKAGNNIVNFVRHRHQVRVEVAVR